ncbi:hypothetical protein SAMN04488107_2898 [Geodermatophilus saharensis]|uniref:Uncharacterized protein n=1 Tax=Geodermatophilus saharensis TaxID=1137994 RepID=A0A239FAP8_9ACTN|nr:hypothetical protein [Geodermatophilus saharensis]SNS53232.1 hypothetical protein SAMN04488107_2898 [Geodermatophilus saharensis]
MHTDPPENASETLLQKTWAVERFAGQPVPEPWSGVDWDATPG